MNVSARSGRLLRLGLLALLIVGAGCSAPRYKQPDWSQYDGPGAEYFRAEEVEFPIVEDPYEPMNRGVSAFNHVIMAGIMSPLSAFYRSFVAPEIRTGLTNVGRNLLYPVRLLASLFQGEWDQCWTETQRFAINTTVGIAGLWDPARDELGIKPVQEDFGKTFHAWGWDRSTYLVLPFLGPSTVRDGLGLIPDSLADPLVYFPPASLVRNFNNTADKTEDYNRFVQANFDPYQIARLIYVKNRELVVENYSFKSDDDAATETLESVFLTYEDPLFPGRGRRKSVRLPSTNKKLDYTVWLQPEPSRIVYILPGLGGHRDSKSSIALAEIVYTNGSTAVTISSAMNTEFIADASTADYPGYAPVDAHDVHVALDAIDEQLSHEYQGRFEERVLAGISLGAFHTLYIAAAEEDPANDLIDFDAYVALDTPISLEHGVAQLDEFYNAPLQWPEAERKDNIEEVLRKTLDLGTSGDLNPGVPIPYTQLEAEFLIGLTFRMTVGQIIVQQDVNLDKGILENQPTRWRRTNAFREANEYSFMEYFYKCVLPYYAGRLPGVEDTDEGARRMFEAVDLRSIGPQLQANEKIRIFANANDFLTRKEDRDWIMELLGPERVHFFPTGGHLGNLHKKDIQASIRVTVRQLLGEEEAARKELEP